MPRVPFHYIDLRTFCYETEDEKRVEDALRTFLPEEYPVDRAQSDGHYGDRTSSFGSRRERRRRPARAHASSVSAGDRRGPCELDQRVTDNTEFFLRLDKQAAFKGEARRGGGLTLRAKVEAYPAKKEARGERPRPPRGVGMSEAVYAHPTATAPLPDTR
ncbi:hypothetical protein C9J85_06040 [Haloferax sp. wsp5]|nr:hypothetical protein C9J85_06040 [Haloferax sp. wsp5]